MPWPLAPGSLEALRPAFRLRTLMIIVVVASLGLAWEVDRRKTIERARLAQIAEGRRSLVTVHESKARELRKQVADVRAWIDRWDGFKSGRGPQVWVGNGSEALRRTELLRRIPDLEARAVWEDLMARNSAWAADHPAEPWPARPPEPIPGQSARTGKVTSTRQGLPVGPARPTVPTVVKKNQ